VAQHHTSEPAWRQSPFRFRDENTSLARRGRHNQSWESCTVQSARKELQLFELDVNTNIITTAFGPCAYAMLMATSDWTAVLQLIASVNFVRPSNTRIAVRARTHLLDGASYVQKIACLSFDNRTV
jgi:hypothetical protein